VADATKVAEVSAPIRPHDRRCERCGYADATVAFDAVYHVFLCWHCWASKPGVPFLATRKKVQMVLRHFPGLARRLGMAPPEAA
jgi:hypothetical protein